MTASSEPAASSGPASGVGAGGRVPDFFIVGHQKCGTSALYRMLRRHPQIYMPAGKEPRFLETQEGAPPVRRPPGAGRTPATLEEYLALFEAALPEQRVGEVSPSYLLSQFAAGRIAELQPSARIIAILREPASYLRSLHLQQLRIHAENEQDLRRALAYEPARREGRHLPPNEYWVDQLQYSQHIRYVEQLRRYHAHFAPEQVLVLIYDDLRLDNEGTVRRIMRFLEVDDTQPIELRDSNRTTTVRAQRLYDLTHAVSAGDGVVARGARAAARAIVPQRLGRKSALAIRNRLLLAEPAPPDEGLMRELRVRFKPEVIAASEYLDRDLVTLWGYDAVE
jgi:Sulfotransferase family